MGEVIAGVPQPRMLRHRDDRAASRPSRAEHFGQGGLVLFYVLQDVQGANDVEMRVERQASAVHLVERDSRQPFGGELEAHLIEV